MADLDIDPFSDYDKTGSHPDTGENILLKSGGAMGGSAWEPEREQETSFGGKTHESEIFKEKRVKELYQLLCNKTHQRLEPCLDLFEIGKDGGLYYEGKSLAKRNGELRATGVIASTLGIRRLHEMD